MSDALPLPPRPNLEQYKKLAKDFQHACKSQNPDAIRERALKWVEKLARLLQRQIFDDPRRSPGEARKIEQRWRELHTASGRASRCALSDAQFLVARTHGFASWPKFARHLKDLSRRNSPVSQFETAVDAIVSGNSATLQKLLRENRGLVRMRSTREHRSILLHYVSANGVEDFRQKTPRNIVEITGMLLDAGADVNAESDAYGGHATTLGLTATSWHPENAGVQIPLLELLIARGAAIENPDGSSAVVACLANGRMQAAEFLAGRGARLDLEGAAGVGQLDLVKSFFHEDGSLKPPTTQEQMKDAFAWACEFGRSKIADFLLQKGIAVDTRLRHHGQTGLHWAATGGHAAIVKLLLGRGASVEVRDKAFDGTPLGWALYGLNHSPATANRDGYYEAISLLVRAGAKLDPEWLAEDSDRPEREKLRSDKKLAAIFRQQLA